MNTPHKATDDGVGSKRQRQRYIARSMIPKKCYVISSTLRNLYES